MSRDETADITADGAEPARSAVASSAALRWDGSLEEIETGAGSRVHRDRRKLRAGGRGAGATPDAVEQMQVELRDVASLFALVGILLGVAVMTSPRVDRLLWKSTTRAVKATQMTKAADIIVKNTSVGRKISNELAKDINVVSSTVSDVKSATVGAAQKMDKALDRALDNVIEVAIDEGDHGDPDGTTVQESLSTSTNRRISNFNGEFGGGESASEALLRQLLASSQRMEKRMDGQLQQMQDRLLAQEKVLAEVASGAKLEGEPLGFHI